MTAVVSMREALAWEPLGPGHRLLQALAHARPLGWEALVFGRPMPLAARCSDEAATLPRVDAPLSAGVGVVASSEPRGSQRGRQR